jgi:hypothetical protein
MAWLTAIRDELINDATLTALIGTRCYRNNVPTTATLPYIVLHRISTPRLPHFGAASGIVWPREQCNCYADDVIEAYAVADAVREAWDGWTGGTLGSGGNTATVLGTYLEDEADDYIAPGEGELVGIYVVRMDLTGVYRESVPTF